jgi:hypothetical protein
MKNLNLFILFILLPCAVYPQQNVDINEPFEGSWPPSGWQSSSFSQNISVNHSIGGTKSAEHGISIFGTGSITSPPFQVIDSEEFDTISFWVRHSSISISGTMSIDIIGSVINQNLASVNLNAVPSNTWVKYSYSYTAAGSDFVSVRLSFTHALSIGNVYVDDFRIHKLFALPVVLAYFSHNISGNNVSLSWKTIQEINNMGFELYRTDAGQTSSWQKIGFLVGAGTTTEPREYYFSDNKLNTGKYLYRLKQIDYNANYEYFQLPADVTINAPANFMLEQNYPNPSNPSSTIGYHIPENAVVAIKIYDIAGKQVKELVNSYHTAGYYKAVFDGSEISSGIYFYKITAGSYSNMKKMILIK